MSPEDDAFLDTVERKAFDFFVEEHHPDSGLVKDLALNGGRDHHTVASIAATGFGLAAMCVGAERGWITKKKAQRYCEKTLNFFLTRMEHNHGFFFHFVHWGTGKKTNQTELSSIDTALLLAGALTAAEYFKGTKVEQLANRLYERVDFDWMLNGGKTLSMGWDRNTGFLKQRWDTYNEGFILYLLAVASPTHPIPADSWHAVRKRVGLYGKDAVIYCPPLFTHQYSQVFVDLRDKNDGFADYFQNSRTATLINRQFCIDNKEKYKTYSENVWGLTASQGPNGYKAYGAEPGGAVHDGTIAPTAAGGSIVFTPELSLQALKTMREQYGDKIWGKYGFCDAFNADRDWYSNEVLGIDQGPLLLMIENYRTELLWKYFMRHPAAARGLEKIGFKPGTIALPVPERPEILIPPLKKKVTIDGDLKEWDLSRPVTLTLKDHRELGEIGGDEDLKGELFFRWSRKYLYLAVRVSDDSLVMKKAGDKIWKDDCLELFVDPKEDGLKWGNREDFQIGLSPGEWENEGRTWAWFQGVDPAIKKNVFLRIRRVPEGYNLEARIAWSYLGITPQAESVFGLTPALHDIDLDNSEGKFNWFMLPDGKDGRLILGKAVLKKAA